MTSLDWTSWATIIGTWVLVVGTLSFAYWQLRQAQRLHSATTLLDLRERYFSPRMKKARKEFSLWLIDPKAEGSIENWEVPIFFEQIGFLTRAGVLEKRMVWNAFGSWVAAYHHTLTHPEDIIAKWRTEDNDPLILREFEWLAKELVSFESRLSRSAGGSEYSHDDARFIMEVESKLRGASADD